MKQLARVGSVVEGGEHCHGHDHGPQSSPGTIVRGSGKVYVRGRPVAREGDVGFSPGCCGNIGLIEVETDQEKVYIEGRPAAGAGTPTRHCKVGAGHIVDGEDGIFIP